MHMWFVLIAVTSLFCVLNVCSGSSAAISQQTPHVVEISPRRAFSLNQDLLDWKEAFQECKTWNATLAFPNSPEEGATLRRFLVNTVNNDTKEIHLGFHSMFSEGNFSSLEGRDMDQFGYWQWDPQSENGTEQRCGALTVDGMKTIDCDTRQQSICEYKGTQTFDKIDGYGYYHYFNMVNVNWTHAVTICKMETAHLLILRSGGEYDALFSHYSQVGVAINGTIDILYGAHRLFADDWFLTLGDEPVEESGYDVWAPDEPGDLPDADFPVIGLHLTDQTTSDADAGMFVLPGETTMPFICKRELH